MADQQTVLTPEQEDQFQGWYASRAAKYGLDLNPDDQRHFYDYRAAFLAGTGPDSTGHWPSEFKKPGHPRMYENADGSFSAAPAGPGSVNTKTGRTVPSDDVSAIVERLRALRNSPTAAAAVDSLPPTMIEPTRDQSRAYTRDLLTSQGHDPATVDSIVPPSVSVPTPEPDLSHVTATSETAQSVQDRETQGIQIPKNIQDRAQKFLEQHKDEALSGLASVNKVLNKIATKAGEVAAGPMKSGSTNLHLGLALLDVFTKLDNELKIDWFAPAEQKARLRMKYLPKEKIVDPTVHKEFDTATEMAMWSVGQKVWGGMNELASLPPTMASKVLGTLGMPAASAYMGDLAQRDQAVAQQKEDLAYGQIPSMIAGMHPVLGYQEIWESGFDPKELDDIYAQMADPGNHGMLTAAAISGIGALADFYGSPSVMITGAVGRAHRAFPAVLRAVAPGKAAEITSEIARTTTVGNRYEAATEAVKAAQKVVDKAQALVDESPTPERTARLHRAVDALNREQHWFSQFEDPGTYEPIIPRAARRNPAYIPEPTERQYPLSAGGRYTTRVKSFEELAQESLEGDARRRALTKGADMPVDWHSPDNGLTAGDQQQRILLGPSDSEYAGDALNLLARGAEIDDVTMASGLAPEYYILPDVSTSLTDIRKLTETQQFEAARKMTEGAPSANTLEERMRASGEFPGTPGERSKLTPYDLLTANERINKGLLADAKRAGNREAVEELRAQARILKNTKANLAKFANDKFDERMMPVKQKGIMQDPARFNNWLEVAGNRVIRSLYPGGLQIHGWDTKLGQMTSMGREPMRYYMSYDPDAWERIRSGVMRYDRFNRAGYNLMMRELENAGVIVARDTFDPAKAFSPQRIESGLNEKLFDMLNTTVKSEEHLNLYESAGPELRRAHDRIRSVLDHFADMQGISDTQRYLEGYIRHVFDISDFMNGQRSIEYIGLPAGAEQFASHLQERAGAEGYTKDAVLALDLYVRAAYKKLIMEPVYGDIQATGEELAKKFGNTAHISYANDLINQLKGKPSFVGAKIDEAFGASWNSGGGVKVPFMDKKLVYRPGAIDRTAHGIFSVVHSGLTTGPHYALLQMASGTITTASRIGPFDTMRGLLMMVTDEGQQLSKAAGTYKPFVDFMEAPSVRKFTETMQNKVPMLPTGMTNAQAESVSRGITFNAAFKMYMRKAGAKNIQELEKMGLLKRTMFEAVRVSEEANHLYGPLGRSPWVTRLMGSSGSTAVQQLLSYIPKQSEELLGQTMRHPGAILEYLAYSGHVTRMAANSGIDMTQDVGLGYLPESVGDLTSPAVDLALQNLQFLDALDRNDAASVEKYGKAMAKMVESMVPFSQMAQSISKAAQRGKEGVVRTGGGEVLYRMDMGKEAIPTVLLQRNIYETLNRRAEQMNVAEDRRFAYNAQKAVDHYVDALEAGDSEASYKLQHELQNVYKTRITSLDPIERAREARSYSQRWRSLDGNQKLKDIYWRNYRLQGANIQP